MHQQVQLVDEALIESQRTNVALPVVGNPVFSSARPATRTRRVDHESSPRLPH
jgi:hypothetical protein